MTSWNRKPGGGGGIIKPEKSTEVSTNEELFDKSTCWLLWRKWCWFLRSLRVLIVRHYTLNLVLDVICRLTLTYLYCRIVRIHVGIIFMDFVDSRIYIHNKLWDIVHCIYLIVIYLCSWYPLYWLDKIYFKKSF